MKAAVLETGIDGFNRTFMELKFSCALNYLKMKVRFNRTFMELKLYIPCIYPNVATV